MPEFSMFVQCTNKETGVIGDFIVETATGAVVSPTFQDLIGLFAWMKINGYKLAEYATGKFVPLAVAKV